MNNPYQHSVIDYYVAKVRKMRQERKEALSSLKSREDALAYQERIRQAVANAFGPFPKEKCPLDAEVTGVIQCDGYRIEKVRFYSRPGYMVTANLYVPDGLTKPAPASLGACGHSNLGKACDTYQRFPIRLVKNGFVVLLYDPVHQGERNQYVKLDYLGQGAGLCQAHNVMGEQLELVGESMPSWRVWDGIRALDYLLTRPDVDATRIGITGNSGGGTLSEWIWANDSRLAFAGPSCHVTTFMGNLENELATDAEQCPHGIISAGLEMVDLMFCQAPKPVILLGQKYDFFERRGYMEAYNDLRHFYSLFDAEGHVAMHLGGSSHGYSDELQKAMVSFFRQAAGIDGEMLDEEPQMQATEALNVCASGNVVNEGSTPIYEIISGIANKLAAKRKAPASQKEWADCIVKLLDIPKCDSETPHFRVLRAQRMKEQVWARYAIETEDNIQAILHKRLPQYPDTLDIEDEITLYLPHFSTWQDNNEHAECMTSDTHLYTLDVRGIGESMLGETETGFLEPYGMDYMVHSFGFMLGQSYMGRRVFDVLRSLDLLEEDAKNVHLVGRGQGAILAAFVAMLRPELKSITLHDAPASFQEWIEAKVCDWPAGNIPFGVLKYFDLPDLYAALEDKITIASKMNAYMKR